MRKLNVCKRAGFGTTQRGGRALETGSVFGFVRGLQDPSKSLCFRATDAPPSRLLTLPEAVIIVRIPAMESGIPVGVGFSRPRIRRRAGGGLVARSPRRPTPTISAQTRASGVFPYLSLFGEAPSAHRSSENRPCTSRPRPEALQSSRREIDTGTGHRLPPAGSKPHGRERTRPTGTLFFPLPLFSSTPATSPPRDRIRCRPWISPPTAPGTSVSTLFETT